MSVALLSVAIVLMIVGLIGCVIPVVPGPALAYCGLLCMIPTSKAPSSFAIAVFGVAALVVTVLDYVVPALGAKRFKCSKCGTWGCVVGTFVGIFFFPLGLLLGLSAARLPASCLRASGRARPSGADSAHFWDFSQAFS